VKEETVFRSSRTLTRCLVCGFAEVRTDEVVDGGVLFLTRCPRCDHRTTAHAPTSRPVLLAVRAPERAEESAAA
jgi:ribosomal protein S27E